MSDIECLDFVDYFEKHWGQDMQSGKKPNPAPNVIHIESVPYKKRDHLGEYTMYYISPKKRADKEKRLPNSPKDCYNSDFYPTLKVTIKKYREQKGIDTQTTLCIMANMDESRLSKEINGHRPIKRDTLFALALAMRLSREETEVLFHVADKDLYSTYSLTRQDIEREQLLKGFIGNSKCTVQDINLKLKNKGMKILGNFEDEVDDFSVAM